MPWQLLFRVISIALFLDSLNCILYSLAQFSIFERSECAYTSASDSVFPWVRIARSSAKAIVLVWLVNFRFKRVLYSTFQSNGPQEEP